MKKDELGVPISRKRGWVLIFIGFGLLAITGFVLTLLYRDAPKMGDIIAKEKTKNAKAVVYAIVFSNVDAATADTVINTIVHEIGPDTAHTDLVIGCPSVDPWCANVEEYKRNLRKAMSQSSYLDIGKQTQIVSMVTGLLVKSKLPATVYFIGTLHHTERVNYVSRTLGTINGIEVRNASIGPVKTVFYLRPVNDTLNANYLSLFSGTNFRTEVR